MAEETEAFEVIVGTQFTDSAERAVAHASRVLAEIPAYANGNLFNVNVYGGDGEQIAVGICFDTDIIVGDDYGLKKFMDSCTEHRSVESVERVSFVPA